MVLVEDMVSRKHAKIVTEERTVSIQDLGSTNGTFVNGEKIRKVELKDGDRILIGTSIIKLVSLDGQQVAAPAMSETEARSKMQSTANKRPAPKSMSGSIEEIPLPDLLQLLSTSRKSGVVALRSDWGTGRIYLRKGQIYFATIDESFDIRPRKAIYRMLAWEHGTFALEPPDDREMLEEIQDSTEGLLMEGMRQLDEVQRIGGELPPRNAILQLAVPLQAPLRDLTPVELDVLQLSVNVGRVATVLDRAAGTDMETYEALRKLVVREYLVVRH